MLCLPGPLSQMPPVTRLLSLGHMVASVSPPARVPTTQLSTHGPWSCVTPACSAQLGWRGLCRVASCTPSPSQPVLCSHQTWFQKHLQRGALTPHVCTRDLGPSRVIFSEGKGHRDAVPLPACAHPPAHPALSHRWLRGGDCQVEVSEGGLWPGATERPVEVAHR